MPILNATIPAIWPTPNNPSTRVRIFRVEIDRPMTGSPAVAGHMNEAVEVGTTTFENYRPDCTPRASLYDLLADPELGDTAARVSGDLEQLFYALYLRKKAKLEAPPPVTP